MAPQSGQTYLFVYGSLRQRQGNEMSQWLAKHSRFISTARFPGRLFMVGRYPGAVKSDAPNAWVHGEVFELFNDDGIMQRLDDYEECGPQFADPRYRREREKVFLEDGREVAAWLYLYNRPTDALAEIPSGDFLRP